MLKVDVPVAASTAWFASLRIKQYILNPLIPGMWTETLHLSVFLQIEKSPWVEGHNASSSIICDLKWRLQAGFERFCEVLKDLYCTGVWQDPFPGALPQAEMSEDLREFRSPVKQAGSSQLGSQAPRHHCPLTPPQTSSFQDLLNFFNVESLNSPILAQLIPIIYSRTNKIQPRAKFNLCLPACSSFHVSGRVKKVRSELQVVIKGWWGPGPPQLSTLDFLPREACLNNLQNICHSQRMQISMKVLFSSKRVSRRSTCYLNF